MRYLLFAGEFHYPNGGYNDFYGMGESVDSLATSSVLKDRHIDWFHIYDTEEDCIVVGTRGQAMSSQDLEESDGVQIFTL